MTTPFPNLHLPATARLQLRPLDVSDTQRIFEIWSDPEVMRFYDVAPLTRFEQAEHPQDVKLATLEASGKISVVHKKKPAG